MYARSFLGRMAAATGAAIVLAAGAVSPSQAASGTFFYTRADNGSETFLGSTPNGQCLSIPGGASYAHNDTDTDSNLYTDSSCSTFKASLGSRQSDSYSSPFPMYVRFG
ncbi:hypothetical protein [Streptomyces sp. NPDC002537]